MPRADEKRPGAVPPRRPAGDTATGIAEARDLRMRLDSLNRAVAGLGAKDGPIPADTLNLLRHDLAHAQKQLEIVEAALAGVFASTSWRVTRPLRAARHPRAAVRSAARSLVSGSIRAAASSGPLRRLARRVLAPFPRLRARLRRLTAPSRLPFDPSLPIASTSGPDLPRRAAQVYRRMAIFARTAPDR